jgi:hypothetical protein
VRGSEVGLRSFLRPGLPGLSAASAGFGAPRSSKRVRGGAREAGRHGGGRERLKGEKRQEGMGAGRLGGSVRLPGGSNPSKPHPSSERGGQAAWEEGQRRRSLLPGRFEALKTEAQERCRGETNPAGRGDGLRGTARWKRRNATSGLRRDLATPSLWTSAPASAEERQSPGGLPSAPQGVRCEPGASEGPSGGATVGLRPARERKSTRGAAFTHLFAAGRGSEDRAAAERHAGIV